MTTEHSKGPWRYDYYPGYCGELIAADGTTICTFSDEPKPTDAMVMCAAPDLLLALERITSSYHALLGRTPVRDAPETLAEADAAIRKARGAQ